MTMRFAARRRSYSKPHRVSKTIFCAADTSRESITTAVGSFSDARDLIATLGG
jgi:hypothetical protein